MPTEAERPGLEAAAMKEATAAPISSIGALLELLMKRRLKRDLIETQH
jgi:hypothetical protein